MVFSDLFFIFVFLPVFLLCYLTAWLVDKNWLGSPERPSTAVRNAVLVVFSLIFYAWGEPVYVFLMLCSVVVNYLAGRVIDSQESHRRAALVMGITVNLLRNGNQYDQVELNPDNQWVHTWSRLNDRYTWSVEEESVPAGYSVSYATEGTTTTITNKKTGTTPTVPGDPPPSPSSPPGPVDITVVKAWEDNGRNRPDSVKATLYNGETAVETVIPTIGLLPAPIRPIIST